MSTQTAQATVIDSAQLDKLEKEIEERFREILKTAGFDEVFKKYGISEANILKFSSSLDLTKIKVSGQNTLLALPQERKFAAGCWCPCKGLCPCEFTCP